VAKEKRTNRKCHRHVCLYCGIQFFSARPESGTHDGRCRSRLSDFQRRYKIQVGSPLYLTGPARSREARELARMLRVSQGLTPYPAKK
jgi:hypothetical protein